MVTLQEYPGLDALRIRLIEFLDESSQLASPSQRDAWIQRCLPKRRAERLQPRNPIKRDDLTNIFTHTQLESSDKKLVWLNLWDDLDKDAAELDSYEVYQSLKVELEGLDEFLRGRRASTVKEGRIDYEDLLPDDARGNMLRTWGFRIDPFIRASGSTDDHLLEYYWVAPGSDFLTIFGEPLTRDASINLEPVFVFGPPGSGKSSMRNAIAQKARQGKILPVVIHNFSKLIAHEKADAHLSIDRYLQQIVYFTVERLALEIEHERITRSPGWDSQESMRNILAEYTRYFPAKAADRLKLKQYLQPTEEAVINWQEETAESLLADFCSMVCDLFGYRAVYFLIDPDELPVNLQWKILQPLVSNSSFLGSTGGKGAFKFFLDESYIEAVRSVDWIAARNESPICQPLEWAEKTLIDMLADRLSKSNKPGRSRNSLEALSNGINQLDQILVSQSGRSPQKLIQLCNRLLKQHLESGLGDAAITQEDVDAVMKEDAESHLAQDILAGTLRLTEKTLRGVIHSGENQWVEFKSTLFTDIRDPKQKKDSDWSPDEAVMREIGAFANSKGGIIVLGVSDEGLPYSLNADLARFKKEKSAPDKQAEDGFRNALSGVIEKHISPLPSDLQISFFSFSGSRVCVIQVPAALYPIYVKKINHHFFIRQDNRVKEMDVYEAVVYMDSHYGEVCPVCRRPKLDGLDRSIKRD